jgi:NfeD-like partner-binding protein
MGIHVGDRGIAETALYLTGTVRIGGERHTAKSDSGPVEPGAAVVVVGDDMGGLVVRPVEPGREADRLPDHGRPLFTSPQERAAAVEERREAEVRSDWAAHRRRGLLLGAVVGAGAGAVVAWAAWGPLVEHSARPPRRSWPG